MNDVSYIINNAKASGAATARAKVWDHYIQISTKLNDAWDNLSQEERVNIEMIRDELKSVITDLDEVVDKFAC